MGFFKAPHKLRKKAASAVNKLGKQGPHSLVSKSGAATPTAKTGGAAQRMVRPGGGVAPPSRARSIGKPGMRGPMGRGRGGIP